MAFDLQYKDGLNSRRENIFSSEENFFNLIEENINYPILNFIWENFYESPKLEPEKSNQLVHELVALNEEYAKHSHSKQINHFTSRLIPFFNTAYLNDKTVICMSD